MNGGTRAADDDIAKVADGTGHHTHEGVDAFSTRLPGPPMRYSSMVSAINRLYRAAKSTGSWFDIRHPWDLVNARIRPFCEPFAPSL